MNNLKDLKEKEWAQFKIADLFTITTGANIDKQLLQTGNIPRITAKETCNGIDFFSSELDIRSFKTNKNCLSVSFLGMVCYQSYRASYDMKIHSLVPKSIIFNRYTGLFVATACQMQFSKFSYGNQLSSTDLPKQRIMLPICADGTPDWQYMEDFMKAKEQKILKLTIEKLSKLLDKSETNVDVATSWKDFFLDDIVNIDNGKRLTKANMKNGDIPFIGASELCNGITAFTSSVNESSDKNVLGVNYNGSVACSFYHSYLATFSDDVKRLKWKNKGKNNKYTLLFLATLIMQQKIKYAYGYKFNSQRMRRQKIMLPVCSDCTPDWQYMEDFMKAKEQKILKLTIEKFSKELKAIEK